MAESATWLALVETGPDSTAEPERWDDWLRRAGMVPARRCKPAEMRRAVQLRADLRLLAVAAVEGDRPPASSVRAVEQVIARTPDPVRLAGKKNLRRKRPATVDAALARIAREAAEHLTGPRRGTLRICPERDCGRIFEDPAGRRRYCPGSTCAGRGRVRALRARRRAEVTPED